MNCLMYYTGYNKRKMKVKLYSMILNISISYNHIKKENCDRNIIIQQQFKKPSKRRWMLIKQKINNPLHITNNTRTPIKSKTDIPE